MITIGIITASDRSSKGLRSDLSGPAIRGWALERGYSVLCEDIVPDDVEAIRQKLIEYTETGVNIIFTTGGTGFGPRDNTPEATLAVVERLTPGFVEIMRSKSFEITPHALLSRAVAGIRSKTLIINLSGSPKAVLEQLGFIQQSLPHAVDLINGRVRDCATESSS